MPDLTMVSTEALLDELFSRYDGSIFAGVQHLTLDQERADYSFHGGKILAHGLVIGMQEYLKTVGRFVNAEDHEH